MCYVCTFIDDLTLLQNLVFFACVRVRTWMCVHGHVGAFGDKVLNTSEHALIWNELPCYHDDVSYVMRLLSDI